MFFSNCLILGWIGGKSIETPFYEISQIATIFYFTYLLILIPLISKIEDFFWDPNSEKNIKELLGVKK